MQAFLWGCCTAIWAFAAAAAAAMAAGCCLGPLHGEAFDTASADDTSKGNILQAEENHSVWSVCATAGVPRHKQLLCL
jgi:hypothetical protein